MCKKRALDRKSDDSFSIAADEAIEEGSSLVNDLAESQLISLIKNGNLGSIIFWLNHHHKKYTTRVELDAKLNIEKEELTPEQESLVNNALKLAGLLTADKKEGKHNGNNK